MCQRRELRPGRMDKNTNLDKWATFIYGRDLKCSLLFVFKQINF